MGCPSVLRHGTLTLYIDVHAPVSFSQSLSLLPPSLSPVSVVRGWWVPRHSPPDGSVPAPRSE